MDLDNYSTEAAPVIRAAPRFGAKRIVAGVAGVVALLLTAIFTLGGALVAAIGMGVGATIARKRGKSLTRTTSWIAAVVAVAIVLLGVLGFSVTRVGGNGLKEFRQAMDSAQAHPRPAPTPPAWLERMAPGAAARANARAKPPNPALTAAIGIWAVVLVTAMFTALGALIAGTFGWLATLPLAYAITGRWIGSPVDT